MSDSFSTDGGQRINPDGSISTSVRWTDPAGNLYADVDAVQVPGVEPGYVSTMTLEVIGNRFTHNGPPRIMLLVGGVSLLLFDGTNSDFLLPADLAGYLQADDVGHDYSPISLFGSWEPLGGDSADPEFWVDSFGICHLRGTVTNPDGASLGESIGGVPTTYDGGHESFLGVGSGGLGYINVTPDTGGTGAFLTYVLGDADPDLWLNLSGITYPT